MGPISGIMRKVRLAHGSPRDSHDSERGLAISHVLRSTDKHDAIALASYSLSVLESLHKSTRIEQRTRLSHHVSSPCHERRRRHHTCFCVQRSW